MKHWSRHLPLWRGWRGVFLVAAALLLSPSAGTAAVGDISFVHGGYSVCQVQGFPAKWTPSGALKMFWNSSATKPDVEACKGLLVNSPKWHRFRCPEQPLRPECVNMRRNRCTRQWPHFVCAADACKPKFHTAPAYEHTVECVVNWCKAYNDATYTGSPAQPPNCQ